MSVVRDESLPRQSAIFAFLTAEEFKKISPRILSDKAAEGTMKHKILHETYGKSVRDNVLARMFSDGLKKIFKPDELMVAPVFEEQINGKMFTGAPDFRLLRTLIDYKFTDILRPKTALQLVSYAMLIFEIHKINIDRHFGFHFPNDRALFIHRVPDRTVPILVDYTKYVVDHHKEIVDGKLARYDALIQWDEIQQDYEIFEYVASVLPPPMIIDAGTAIEAAHKYALEVKMIEDYGEVLNTELKRYMQKSGEIVIGSELGYGVKLQRGAAKKVHDPFKKAQAKAVYDKALESCIISSEETTRLVRYKPAVKKPRLIK